MLFRLLPFTGPAVSLIIVLKTIFKICHRLQLMSAIYGHTIADHNRLFVVSARILQNLQTWESDPDHRPLEPEALRPLYESPDAETERSGLPALLEATIRKEAYIAIPGVGTVGLAKIELDDARMDAAVRALSESYFAERKLRTRLGAAFTERMIRRYAEIYEQFRQNDFFNQPGAAKETEADISAKLDAEVARIDAVLQKAPTRNRAARLRQEVAAFRLE